MHAEAPIESPPPEIRVLILDSIVSPIDFRSFATSSPIYLETFRKYRHSLLQSRSTEMSTLFRDEYLLSQALLACRLQWISRDFPYMDPTDIEQKVKSTVQSRSRNTDSQQWQGSLFMLCELYRLREELSYAVAEYAVEAWKKLVNDAKQLRGLHLKWPLRYDQTLRLSHQEICRIEEGFIEFEIRRHYLHFQCTKLCDAGVPLGMRFPIWSSSTPMSPTILEGYAEPDWNLRAFQSIFRFMLDKHRGMVHLVHDATSSVSHLDRLFQRRTLHQELEFATTLCTQGLKLLGRLRFMSTANIQQFIVTSFHCYVMRKPLIDRSCEGQNMASLDSYLEIISGEVDPAYWLMVEHGTAYWNSDYSCDPWTRARYFWDRSRIEYLRSFKDGDTRPSDVYNPR
ncbi:Ff.00g011660.m01.CDS01 [Fusarium sp. VM40]|nr:Ff.00g011660.m01.CDS01 [Fusarium sp. VM40]